MKTYKHYLTEMSDEVAKFRNIRERILQAESKEQIIEICKLLEEYNDLYGDEDLSKKLKKLRDNECAMSLSSFALRKSKKHFIKVFNWHNKRRQTKDIRENIHIEIADILYV